MVLEVILAAVLLVQGQSDEAKAQIEYVLDFLEHRSLDGADDAGQVYLTAYRVLHAVGDPRAQTMLAAGQMLLGRRAESIQDESRRCSYLENVRSHRQLAAIHL